MTSVARIVCVVVLLSLPFLSHAQNRKATKPRIVNLKEVINAKAYPEKLKKEPKEGKIVMDIWLDREGQILKYKAIIAENEDLRVFIEKRLPLLQFTPARDDQGIATYSKVRVPFEFSMNEQNQ